MSNTEIGSLFFLLLTLLASAHLCGYLFTRLRQPKVIGEILAGVLLGPSLLGRFAPSASRALFAGDPSHEAVLNFLNWLGLMLLMFVSGTEARRLFGREDRRQVAYLALIGTGLPFLVTLGIASFIPLEGLMGPAGHRSALILVIGIAVAVTSIPVISRIFHDLKILHTRFARLVLGVAVLEDIALWAVLAIATSLARSSARGSGGILQHVLGTLIFLGLGLTITPVLLKRLHHARWNVLAVASPVGYLFALLFGFTAIAAVFDVNIVFAAFLAGFGVASEDRQFGDAMDSLGRVSFSVFVPVYFVLVGYKLDLGKGFSFSMLLTFILGACLLKIVSVGVGAKLAGFKGLDVLNLAVATNARGGPGIVLASVAYEAGIINAAFYTTLVLLAIITSQAAGAWLEYVLRKGWPLLGFHVSSELRPDQANDIPTAT